MTFCTWIHRIFKTDFWESRNMIFVESAPGGPFWCHFAILKLKLHFWKKKLVSLPFQIVNCRKSLVYQFHSKFNKVIWILLPYLKNWEGFFGFPIRKPVSFSVWKKSYSDQDSLSEPTCLWKNFLAVQNLWNVFHKRVGYLYPCKISVQDNLIKACSLIGNWRVLSCVFADPKNAIPFLWWTKKNL